MTVKSNPLKSKFFHSFDPDTRDVQMQGQIIDAIDEVHYLVSTYDWIMGEYYCMMIFHISEMKNWKIHNSADDMREFYDTRIGPQQKK